MTYDLYKTSQALLFGPNKSLEENAAAAKFYKDIPKPEDDKTELNYDPFLKSFSGKVHGVPLEKTLNQKGLLDFLYQKNMDPKKVSDMIMELMKPHENKDQIIQHLTQHEKFKLKSKEAKDKQSGSKLFQKKSFAKKYSQAADFHLKQAKNLGYDPVVWDKFKYDTGKPNAKMKTEDLDEGWFFGKKEPRETHEYDSQRKKFIVKFDGKPLKPMTTNKFYELMVMRGLPHKDVNDLINHLVTSGTKEPQVSKETNKTVGKSSHTKLASRANEIEHFMKIRYEPHEGDDINNRIKRHMNAHKRWKELAKRNTHIKVRYIDKNTKKVIKTSWERHTKLADLTPEKKKKRKEYLRIARQHLGMAKEIGYDPKTWNEDILPLLQDLLEEGMTKEEFFEDFLPEEVQKNEMAVKQLERWWDTNEELDEDLKQTFARTKRLLTRKVLKPIATGLGQRQMSLKAGMAAHIKRLEGRAREKSKEAMGHGEVAKSFSKAHLSFSNEANVARGLDTHKRANSKLIKGANFQALASANRKNIDVNQNEHTKAVRGLKRKFMEYKGKYLHTRAEADSLHRAVGGYRKKLAGGKLPLFGRQAEKGAPEVESFKKSKVHPAVPYKSAESKSSQEMTRKFSSKEHFQAFKKKEKEKKSAKSTTVMPAKTESKIKKSTDMPGMGLFARIKEQRSLNKLKNQYSGLKK